MKLLALLLAVALAWGTAGCGGPRGSLPPAAEGGSSPSSSGTAFSSGWMKNCAIMNDPSRV